jgi:RHS repeat-associated protein
MGAVSDTAIGPPAAQIQSHRTYNRYQELAKYTVSVVNTTLTPATSSDLYSVTYDDGASNPRDKLGRIVHRSDSLDGDTTYTYDAANRLSSVQVGGGTSVNYYYDKNGNRRLVADPNNTDTQYDDDDRLLQWAGRLAYTWKDDGQLATRHDLSATASELTTYTYDQFGDLTEAEHTASDGTTTYDVAYLLDGMRRRVARGTVSNGAFTATERYFYLDNLRIGAVQHAGANGPLSAVTYFIYGTRRNIPDLAVNDDNGTTTTYRIISDQLGSPRFVVNVDDPTGAQPFQASYDAWGNSTRSGIGTGNANWRVWFPFDFAGGLYDPDTKLVRFGARDYDPEVGRWTNRDPIRFDGGQGNLYVYAGDDPVNHRDPTGRDMCSWIVGMGCGIGYLGFDVASDGLGFLAGAGALTYCTTLSEMYSCTPDPQPQPQPQPSGGSCMPGGGPGGPGGPGGGSGGPGPCDPSVASCL